MSRARQPLGDPNAMRSNIRPLRLFGLAALGLVVFAASPVRAEDVRVTVIAILASTDKDAPVDKELEAVAALIRQKNPQFTGFRLGKMHCKPIAVGKEDTFPLIDDEVATVSIVQGKDMKDRIQLKVKPPQLSEITLG